jgi:hypothetical protein
MLRKILTAALCAVLLVSATPMVKPQAKAVEWVCPKNDPLVADGCVVIEQYTLALKSLIEARQLLREHDPTSARIKINEAADHMGMVGSYIDRNRDAVIQELAAEMLAEARK